LEIKEADDETIIADQKRDKKSVEGVLLNAPVLMEEELKNIENVGRVKDLEISGD